MIITLEGPIKSGKSTLFDALHMHEDVLKPLRRHLHWFWYPKRKWTLTDYACDQRLAETFTHMYDYEDDLVITDRIWPVSTVVYGRLRKETFSELILTPPWLADFRVIHLPGDDDLPETPGYYVRIQELQFLDVPCITIPRIPIAERTQKALEQIIAWCI
jgi:hypothetical protein